MRWLGSIMLGTQDFTAMKISELLLSVAQSIEI